MQSSGTDPDVACASQARAVLKAFYLVSGAAAQLGASGQPIRKCQWLELARTARNASAVLGARDENESETMASFRRLADLCEALLARRALGHACPSGVWRELARVGRDAYEQIDA